MFPLRSILPSADGIWAGVLIDQCWTEGAYEDRANTIVETLEGLEKVLPIDSWI